MKAWQEPWGDRRQEIVFISTNRLDRKKLIAALDTALLTDKEFADGPEAWYKVGNAIRGSVNVGSAAGRDWCPG